MNSRRKRLSSAAVAATAALIPATAVVAFVAPGRGRLRVHTTPRSTVPAIISPTSLVASTLENPAVGTVTNSTDWGAAGVVSEQPEITARLPRTSLDVRIHGVWYDLTGWRKAHPAGDHWLDWYDGRDATEVMDGFHSAKARKMYARLPKSKPEVAQQLEAAVPADSKTQVAFRKLFNKLEADGWWKRDMRHEGKLLGIWGGLVAVAALTAKSLPVLSCTLLSLSMTAAGWLGHDYIHGIDPFADKLRNFAAFAAGLYPVWWSDKHNKHHALSEYLSQIRPSVRSFVRAFVVVANPSLFRNDGLSDILIPYTTPLLRLTFFFCIPP